MVFHVAAFKMLWMIQVPKIRVKVKDYFVMLILGS